jgi:hypothetical protein
VEVHYETTELEPLVRQVIEVAVRELGQQPKLLNGKLAVTEPEAAALLGLNVWQLRDLRLDGRIGFSRIVGGRIRYTGADLDTYLESTRQAGKVVA